MTKTLWVCGDSNSGGLANALTPVIPKYKAGWSVVNQAVGAETSLVGVERVADAMAAAVTPPAIALLCWGAADALHEFAMIDPVHAATLNSTPVSGFAATRPGAAARMITLAREMQSRGTVPIIARGVGVFKALPHPNDVTWTSRTPAHQEAARALVSWLSLAYKQVHDSVQAEDIRVMTDPSGARSGYHMDEHDSSLWSPDALHLSLAGYESLACRVISYLDREGLWNA